MPNWCDNRLAIAGPPATVRELVRTLESDDGPLDFDTVVPMPPELRSDLGDEQTPSGFPRWYQWAVQNWGTKWNAYDATRRGYGRSGRVRYRFFTAYGPPDAFLDRVAARWPEVELRLTFEIEFLGDGHATWRAGRRTEDSWS